MTHNRGLGKKKKKKPGHDSLGGGVVPTENRDAGEGGGLNKRGAT